MFTLGHGEHTWAFKTVGTTLKTKVEKVICTPYCIVSLSLPLLPTEERVVLSDLLNDPPDDGLSWVRAARPEVGGGSVLIALRWGLAVPGSVSSCPLA